MLTEPHASALSPEHLLAIVEAQRLLLVAGFDLDATLERILLSAQRLTGAHAAVIEMAEGDQMVYRHVTGDLVPFSGMRLPMATSLSGRCLREGQMLVCQDSETDPRVDREACRKVNARSMIVVPLQAGAETMGVLKVLAAIPNAFSQSSVQTLELLSGFMGIALRDARHREQLDAQNELLRQLAYVDVLTGLPNRAAFLTKLGQLLLDAPSKERHLAIVFMDLDGFKAINDTFGHAAGDKVLCEVARRLQTCVRGGDMVARLGGDEFTALLSDMGEPQDARLVIRRLQLSFQAPIELGTGCQQIGCSMGSSLGPDDGWDVRTLMRKADIAMYRAKKSGQGCVAFSGSLD